MKRLIFYLFIWLAGIALVVFLSGCNPCKRLWRICPPVIVDSIRVDSVWTLDTIALLSPSDTLYIGQRSLNEIGIAAETQDQKVTVLPDKTVEFICKEDSLETIIRVLRYQLNSQRTFIKEVIKPVYVTKNSRYHTLAGILAPIFFLLLGGAVFLLFKK